MTTTAVPVRSVPILAVASGALATTMVGASVPVTGLLAGYPVLSGLAIRYGIGALVLYAWLRRSGRPLPRPGPRDLAGLTGMVGAGMLGFNATILVAQRYAEPGFVAAMIGGAPLILALAVPALRGRRPSATALIGAIVVTGGVVVLSGGGSWHGPGLVLSALTVVGEVLFTVSGAGVAQRLGVLEACVLATGLAAVSAATLSTVVGGAGAWPMPSATQWLALAGLGALLTAIGFLAWYRSISVLGADRAGVLIGLMPVSGLAMSVLLGAQPITLIGIGGALMVGAGCVVGLRPRHS